MQHFFVSPACLESRPVTVTGDQAYQIRRVLRMRPGERALLLDGEGWSYEAALIAADQAGARFEIVGRHRSAGEPRLRISLYQAVLKGDRFDWALQKGTEVGVSRFIPLICRRSVAGDPAAAADKRMRWQRIIREAAEQSGRGRLPELAPAQSFRQAIELPAGSRPDLMRLLPWEGERELHLREALAGGNLRTGSGIELLVGPEGGFSEEEVDLARQHGVRPVSLGPRILRAETAGVIAAALALYEAGEE